MNIEITSWSRTWAGAKPQEPLVERIDLQHKQQRFIFVVKLGNGDYDEARIEADGDDALAFVRALLIGTGGGKLLERSDVEQRTDIRECRMFIPDYDVYESAHRIFFFVNPRPSTTDP